MFHGTLINWHRIERFTVKHVRVTRGLKRAGVIYIENKLSESYADYEIYGDNLLMTEQVAAARPNGAIRIGDVIERIISSDNLERPVSPPARMPA